MDFPSCCAALILMEFPNPAENMKKMNPADQTEDTREERRSVVHWELCVEN